MIDELVYVDEWVPGIRWDSKYATYDNFTGRPVRGYCANRIVGTPTLCGALAQARAKANDVGLDLLLWDGYRPQQAVDCFVSWSKMPEDGQTKARHYPNITREEIITRGYVATKSAHSRGSTVDLTLHYLGSDKPVLMGGIHDLMDPISHHRSNAISPAALANRELLRTVMEDCGFEAYDSEWWHYTLREEPYPHAYFDRPIT